MSFISIGFLGFLFVAFALFSLIKSYKVRLPLLLAANIVFYAFSGSWLGLIIFILIIAYFYGTALLLNKYRKKWILGIGIVFSLFPLILCKYVPHILLQCGMTAMPLSNITLPLGISFFTLQGISYIVDVFRGEIEAERNPLYVGTHLSLFSTVTSGPFCSAKLIFDQLKKDHAFDYEMSADGFRRMGIGLFLKLFVAENIGIVVNTFYNALGTSHYGLMLLVSTAFFGFQLYADFYGYSLMAQGSAEVIGLHLPDNFHQPFMSSSVSSFWSRWHISFQRWLQKYVYIPLGGSRVRLWRILINVLIVFLVSGIWHGSGLTFIAWGILNGAYVCLERLLGLNKKNKQGAARILGFVYTNLLIGVSWIFFRANSINDAFLVFRQIFVVIPTDLIGIARGTVSVSSLVPHNISFLVSFLFSIIAIICVVFLDVLERRKGPLAVRSAQWRLIARWAFYIGIIAIAVGFGVWGGVSEFMYAQF